MKTREFLWGMLVMALGVFATGCSTAPNYYNLGNVSENNFALIQVSPITRGDRNEWPFIDLVKIDGQGDSKQWQGSKAIVKVTPGEHTFTISFIRRMTENFSGQTIFNREIPVSITYKVEAGKGYTFKFSTRLSTQHPSSPTIAEINIWECDVDKNGNFDGIHWILNAEEVAKKTDSFNVTSEDATFSF
jgi:hypothetical protein